MTHILSDFVFQSENWVKDKEKNKIKSKKLYVHIAIHTVLLLLIFKLNLKEYWLGILIIIVSHYLFDVLKITFQNKKTKRRWFFIDQFLHILVLILAATLYTDFTFSVDKILTDKNLLLLIALLLITFVAAIIIKMIITQWNPESKKDTDDSLAKAGRYIGYFRTFICLCFCNCQSLGSHWIFIGGKIGF
ncbi:MAG: DUF3307 domain-containing protein [Polaribacter sp.]